MDGSAADDAGLERVLDEASELIHRDPGAARRLAESCARADSSARLTARADYLRAQGHAIEGNFDTALTLVERARDGFLTAGAEFDALRTELGRMHVLNERGSHDEAIRTGQRALAALATAQDAATDTVDEQQALWLRAKVHHNISICHAFAGRYLRAAEEGRLAEDAYRAAGLPAEVASLHQNRGEQLLDVGRAAEALPVLRRAAEEFHANQDALFEARCHVDAGRAGMLLGRWTDALEAFARARELLERLDVRADLDQVLLRTGEAWLALGLHDEALVAYAGAEPSLRRSGQVYYLAQLLTGMGSALAHAGRLADAERVLNEAADLHRSAGNAPLLAQVLLETADVHDRRGRRDEARVITAAAVDLVRGGEWAIQEVYARLRAADLAHPDLDEAQRHLTFAADLVTSLGLAPLQFRVDARLGHVYRLQGRRAEARRLLAAAAVTVEELRASLPTETLRTSFLRDAAAPYADLVALELDAGDVPAAFAAAERSKSRTLIDLLSALPAARASGAGDRGETGRRLESLEAELLALYSEILRGDDGDAPADVRGPRRAALRERAAEMETLLRAEQVRVPHASPDPVGIPMPLPELRTRLAPDVVVLAYHVVDDEVVAFLVTRDELSAVRDVTRLSRLRPLLRRLDAQWQRFRAGAAFTSRHSSRLLAGAQEILRALHRELITPLGPLPAGARLVVVPHGPLHEVPFHALWDIEQYLLEQHEVSVSPSASVLGATLVTPSASGPPLVLGATAPDAPHMEQEARAVAATLGQARLHVGSDASRARLFRDAPGSSVVHLACHGLYRAESPMFSSLRLADGWVTAASLMQLDLSGALVTLSACESGRTPAGGAGDEVLGLARAALGAGASGVLVSLWLVQDETAARLISRWYELLAAGHRRAQALRTAQLELAAEHPHPYHWAPFVLLGAPDAGPPDPALPLSPAVHGRDDPEVTSCSAH